HLDVHSCRGPVKRRAQSPANPPEIPRNTGPGRCAECRKPSSPPGLRAAPRIRRPQKPGETGGFYLWAGKECASVGPCRVRQSRRQLARGRTDMAEETWRAGDLTAVVGDTAAAGEHRAGYNGLWSLTHRAEAANLFVPTVAGLNFEHIFDGDRRDADNSRRV